MKAFLATTCILTGALLAGGCASKKYVRNTTAPIQAKVDQVGEQTTQNGQQIQETRSQVKQVDERAQSGISAAQEKAATADQHAADAMNKANQADQKADQAGQKADQVMASLRNVVSNLDDYRMQSSVSVPFKFDRYNLDKDAQAELDKLAGDVKNNKRYFVAVEGYTDNVGTKQYNDMLSKRRADAVVEYLVAKHDVPIYRIHMIGLGEERPVDEGKNRAARAKNRRVEVKIFSADHVSTMSGDSTANRVQQNTPPQDNH